MRFIGNSFMRTFARIPQALRLPVKVGGWLWGATRYILGLRLLGELQVFRIRNGRLLLPSIAFDVIYTFRQSPPRTT